MTEPQPRGSKRKKYFTKELRVLMYAYGDVKNPLSETVDVMEELVLEYLTTMTAQARKVAQQRGRMKTEDLLALIKHDPKKYRRATELLELHEEVKNARKAVDFEGLEKAK
eukprot:TRINITY_DN2031_c0_g1_i1.p1 TRINITY_DN2031_c0_g1~~TRINITY_DN2031_c0_g1_i1.p1  ORF type:complete len:111 (-),score=0.73 TRINITY_DN2031_c0_g1_i1:46-378(-)